MTTKSYHFRLLFALVILIFTGCEKNRDNNSNVFKIDGLSVDNYPKVDGSTSAHPLQVLIACKLLDVEYIWFNGPFDEIYRIWPAMDEPNEVSRFISESIVHNGTHQSYVNLIEGNAELIITAREPSGDEIQLADDLNVQLISTPIAIDAFVFIANMHNLVHELTTKEIQGIYTDRIKNWNEVGGVYADIHPYQRNQNSGSQELMENLVMKDLEMPNYPEMILYGMMGPINRISHDHNGLGYTVYFFEKFMAPNDSLKLLAVDGIFPDYRSIKDHEYKYSTEVYVVIREDLDPESNAYKLYELLISDVGQEIVKESGYIEYH